MMAAKRARAALVTLTAFASVAIAAPAGAQSPDRSKPPAIGPAPALRLPAIQKGALANGVPLWVIEQHRVPLAQVNVIMRGGGSLDRTGRFGMASLVARRSFMIGCVFEAP